MIRFMLDSSFCIDVMRNRNAVLLNRFKASNNQMAISTIVLHELCYGAANSNEAALARRKVEEFCAAVLVIDFDDKAADEAGKIRAYLRAKGQTIGGYDTLIAGHARSLGLTLITGNLREFSRVDGLHCQDWLAE